MSRLLWERDDEVDMLDYSVVCVGMVNSQAVGGAGCASRACAGCGGRISDRFLLFSMERYWHTRCLKCSCCQAQLGDIGTTCYSKGGMILCRSDYIRSESACCDNQQTKSKAAFKHNVFLSGWKESPVSATFLQRQAFSEQFVALCFILQLPQQYCE